MADKPPAPGEFYVKDFILYDALGGKAIDVRSWSLKVTGLVEKPFSTTYDELLKRKQIEYVKDFNCVTKWAVKDVSWSGVLLKDLIKEAVPKREADWIMFRCDEGYTTPVPLEDAMSEDAIVALKINGKPLEFERGGPARPFIPSLYGWKSAKWLTEISLISGYRDGYWERYGYHKRGRIMLEERFQSYEWKNIKKHVLRAIKL